MTEEYGLAQVVVVPPPVHIHVPVQHLTVQEQFANGGYGYANVIHPPAPYTAVVPIIRTVMTNPHSQMFDPFENYRNWYEVFDRMMCFTKSDVDMRFWEFREIRDKIAAADCETVLVQNYGHGYNVAFSDPAACNTFEQWFLSYERSHRIDLDIPAAMEPEMMAWLQDQIPEKSYRRVKSGQKWIIYIRDPNEAFHFKVRWSLPKGEQELFAV